MSLNLLCGLSSTFGRITLPAACWIRVSGNSWQIWLFALTAHVTPLCFPAGKPKQKAMGKAVKTPSLTWMEALPPPPPLEDLEPCEQNEEQTQHEEMDLGWVSHTSVSVLHCVVSDFSCCTGPIWYRTEVCPLHLLALSTQLPLPAQTRDVFSSLTFNPIKKSFLKNTIIARSSNPTQEKAAFTPTALPNGKVLHF